MGQHYCRKGCKQQRSVSIFADRFKPLPAPISLCLGEKFNIIPVESTTYFGKTTYKGIGPAGLAYEVHGEIGDSGYAYKKINILNEMQNAYNRIMDW